MESLLVEMDNAHKHDISKFMTRTHHLSYHQTFQRWNSWWNPTWINNYIHYNVWDEITYPFLNFNGATVED